MNSDLDNKVDCGPQRCFERMTLTKQQIVDCVGRSLRFYSYKGKDKLQIKTKACL